MTATAANSDAGAGVRWYRLGGIIASALLLALYARGELAWPLGFILLVPWLLSLNKVTTIGGVLANALLMTVAYVLAAFAWFASALTAFTGLDGASAVLVLCALAPVLQPQLLAYALTRHLIAARCGPLLRMLAAAAAWVGCEWFCGKLFGDTLGHGLYPSAYLRQLADLGGAAGLSLLLILINELLALAWLRWRTAPRSGLPPLALAAALVVLMFGYGGWRSAQLQSLLSTPAPSLRIGMVQTAIVDYERLRQEIGAYAVVREVLDTHFALSRAAIEQHGVDALLWSETVYPTTFGHPRNEDGAALDQEILDFVTAAGVPLVFGSYDLDAAGEYNAAVFVEPVAGLLGYYRKTHPFPLTEHVPSWLDGPMIRRLLPWTGGWQPGTGARVFPLRSADGRELIVLPLICLDGVRPSMAIEGRRLGAQAILSLSNDSWFSSAPLGARLHLAVAAFRSIETRMPQLRVTSNGLSAIIDPAGALIAATAMGDRAVLAGDIPLRDPPATLVVRWGNWVGPAGLALLLALSLQLGLRSWRERLASRRSADAAATTLAQQGDLGGVVLLTPLARLLTALLRLGAALGLVWLGMDMLLRDGLQVNSLAQIRWYLWAVLAPAVAAWVLQRAFTARASIGNGMLILQQRHQRIEVPLASIVLLQPWRVPLPSSGVDLKLASGRRFQYGIACADPVALLHALADAGAPVLFSGARAAAIAEYAALRVRVRKPWLDHPLLKFLLFPLVPALPAFRLHQYIAFGGAFGEYHTYGLEAYLLGLLIWWAAWSIGLMMLAAVLRIVIEGLTLALLAARARNRASLRAALETGARLVFYVGVPVWLVLRMVAP